ncbi:hypothetical protein Cni_G24373 [Canna indica]|uniref:Protein kinase domain-containing protein n=1 Tax=Canna indica TaxID=4628 RepID=A0AAQ3KXX2_9LILI|nr:hypothetical protein Cni_G24373 [Canna indica]
MEGQMEAPLLTDVDDGQNDLDAALRSLERFLYRVQLLGKGPYKFFPIDSDENLNLLADEYPTDPFDRIWWGSTWWTWANVTTNSTVRSLPVDIDQLRAPSAVMETAVIPANGSTMSFYWDFADSGFRNNVFYAYLHFAELVALSPNQSRAFSIFLNGKPWCENFSPSYLQADYVYSDYPVPGNDTYYWEFTSNTTSTLPPILNAREVYSVMFLPNVLTATRDVDAINTIKAEYKVKKPWTGDPCSPIKYKWDGLDCNYDPEPPSIIAVDLSYNNLTGTIPDALGNLSSLKVLFDNPCKDCDMHKKKVKHTILIPSVLGGVLLLSVFAFVVWWIRKRRQQGPVPHTPVGSNKEDCPPHNEDHPSPIDEHHPFVESHFGQIQKPEDYPIKVDSMQFTYTQLAQNLTKARHRNLVKLVGYCIDDKHLALVYEYMPHGSLQAHLKDFYVIFCNTVASFGSNILKIFHALQFLSKIIVYILMISAISIFLLGKDLEAKLVDFGLSKVFSYDETHVSTNMVVGTPGYVDPEYHNTCQLTEKNDVFSFGVVLLELLTGQPPIVPGSSMPHIIQRVSSRLVHGNIDEVVDQRLEGDFDANSAWKLAELAKKCTEQRGTQRPTMTEVVAELKDCLELEVTRLNRENRCKEEFDTRGSSAFKIGGSTAEPIGPFAR